MRTITIFLLGLAVVAAGNQTFGCPQEKKEQSADNTVERRIPPPPDFEPEKVDRGTFDEWLRSLPLKEGNPPVLLYNGEKKKNQDAHAAVIDMEIGARDLQQCADAVIRLRAEYLFASRKFDSIHFNFTSGDRADFSRWAKGFRPVVEGNSVRWVKSAEPDDTYRSFRKYLDIVFTYAGTASLSKELKSVDDVASMRGGDVFIQGGSPGHAIIVVETAAHKKSKKRLFLLAQSYMPAQDIHILKNPNDAAISPWYSLDFGETLVTPEWTFRKTDLKRFE